MNNNYNKLNDRGDGGAFFSNMQRPREPIRNGTIQSTRLY